MSTPIPKKLPKRCGHCPYVTHPYVPASGNLESPLVNMGIGPHNTEVAKGENFVGDSGDVLWPIYNQFDIKRDELFTMNLVQCQPSDDETSKPNPEAVKCCKWYRDKLLKMVKPKVILALGDAPMQALLGKGGITKLHGGVFKNEEYGCKVVPAYHPAYILRNRHLLSQLVVDVQIAIRESASKHIVKRGRKVKTWVIRKISQLRDVLKESRATGILAFDFETTGLNWWRHKAVCLGMAVDDSGAYVLPLREYGVRQFTDEEEKIIGHHLQDILGQDDVNKMAQRINFDRHFAKNQGAEILDLNFDDPKIMQHLVDENAPNGLKPMVRAYTDMGGYEQDLEDDDHKITWAKVPPEKLYKYNTIDCVALVMIKPILKKKLKAEPGLWEYYQWRKELTYWLWHSERKGLPVSYLRLLALREELRGDLSVLRKQMQDETYKGFNPGSYPQLSKVLFVDRRYPVIKAGKTGPSTDDEVLQALMEQFDDPFLQLLSKNRELSKRKNTYVDGWLKRLDLDFRLHTTLHPTGTVTGRLSSTNPNLQNPPRGSTIRSLVKAPPGWDIAVGDLSQAELRVAAVLSKDPKLLAAVRAQQDIHHATATHLFGEAYTHAKSKEEKKEFRALAKTVNFKIVYGGERFEDEKAREVFERLLRTFPGIKKWQQRCRRYVHQGVMVLPTGRRRRFYEVSTDRELKKQYREATNTGPQSLANEWNCKVFVDLWKYVKKNKMKSYPALMVHDSNVGLCPKEESKDYLKEYKRLAERPIPFLEDLVIPVEVGKGPDWSAAELNAKK